MFPQSSQTQGHRSGETQKQHMQNEKYPKKIYETSKGVSGSLALGTPPKIVQNLPLIHNSCAILISCLGTSRLVFLNVLEVKG